MTVDELARILAAYQRAGRGSDRVVVRGYESGLDDAVRVVDAVVVPDANDDSSHYGPHRAASVDGARAGVFAAGGHLGPERERVVWVVGLRDVDATDGLIDPDGSGW